MLAQIIHALLRAYCRTPEHPMKYRFVRWLGRNVFPTQGIQSRVAGDIKLFLHPRDWIEYLLLKGKLYEPLTLQFLSQNLAAGDVAALAGVNFGLHAIVAAKAVGQGGKVFGFEPQPAALTRARDNFAINNVGSIIQLVSTALNKDTGLLKIAWSTSENPGAASVLDHGPGFVIGSAPLPTLLRELGQQRLRVFLLDVEGFELPVLEGIGDFPIDIIIVEVEPLHLKRSGATAQQLLEALRRLGFRLYTLTGIEVDDEHSKELPEKNVVGVRENVGAQWCR